MARDYYEVLGVSRDATADQIQQAFRRLARKLSPGRQQGSSGRRTVQGGQRGLSRAVRPRNPQALRPIRRRLPEGARGPGRAGGRRRRWLRAAQGLPARRVRYGQGFGAPAASTSKTFSATCSAAVADSGPLPGADQEAVLELTVEEAYRGGKRQISLDGPQRTGSTFPPVSSTVSGYGWRDRAAEVAATDRPETCTCGCASSRIPDSGSTDATSPSICRCRRGRRCWGPLSLFELPAAKRKLRCRKGRRPVGGCGCAARHAQPARCRRRPLRGDQGDGATETHCAGT